MSPRLSSSPSRRVVVHGAAALALVGALPLPAVAAEPLLQRPIPRSGEKLPIVGMGTYLVFDIGADPAKQAQLGDVIRALIAGGGRLVDTASVYGPAEMVIGNEASGTPLRRDMFLATKLEARAGQPARDEFARSLQRLKMKSVDLLQLHSVRDGDPPMDIYRAFQKEGLTRYVGATTTDHRDYAAMEALIRRDKPDFVQVDCAIDNRLAEERLIPAAADSGAAVLLAVPLGRNTLFKRVKGKPLPPFAAELGIASWGQYFLKYLLGNPAVTAVIPGTATVPHIEDNLAAARGPMPDDRARKAMVDYFDKLT